MGEILAEQIRKCELVSGWYYLQYTSLIASIKEVFWGNGNYWILVLLLVLDIG